MGHLFGPVRGILNGSLRPPRCHAMLSASARRFYFCTDTRMDMGVVMSDPETKDTVTLPEVAVAENGLMDRRALLRGALLSAGISAVSAGIARADDSVGADAPDWMKTP